MVPFIMQNIKKVLKVDSELWGRTILDPFFPNENFFRKTIDIISMYLLVPFTVQNLKKILQADQNLWGHDSFRPKMAHLPQMRTFLRKNINSVSMYLLDPFTVINFKKSFEQMQRYEDAPFLGRK